MDWLVQSQCGVKKTGNLSGCIFLAIWLGPAFFLATGRTHVGAHMNAAHGTPTTVCALSGLATTPVTVCWDGAGMVLRGCLEGA